jgi:hypothetical protein
MIILLHALIAISGLAVTTFAYFRPSRGLLGAAYTLAGLTLATGTYLVWTSPSHLAEACIVGLVYFTFVTFGIVSVRRKLASITVINDR